MEAMIFDPATMTEKDARRLAAKIRRQKAKADAETAAFNELKALMQKYMDRTGVDTVDSPIGPVTWLWGASTGFDQKKLKADKPELYALYETHGQKRTFRAS